MKSKIPCVMISSTVGDLKDVRNDLYNFITKVIGFSALISEHRGFKVEPLKTAIENCLKRVS